ncbi:FimV/HubP family polar landmark protein [Vogesella oryzae]|uniref:FimV/HubP family polar landmark protein n=1 Tax=Vogesella oryzae TaxID=1735285 RepID=UPI0015843868|nr:FimV/HubP family polar landmark protein [Vogesella oryzae]
MNTVDTVEVDPVAEAEVYLAYGRDQQAEDILRDALAKDPTRHEARLKLMEVYAARQDKAALETHAKELHAVTGGQGGVWAKASALGRSVDPENPLYVDVNAAAAAPTVEVAASNASVDLDKELMGDFEAPVAPAAVATAPVDDIEAALLDAPTPAVEAAPEAAADLEALLHEPEPTEEVAPQPAAAAADNSHMLDFDFNLDTMLPSDAATSEAASPEPAPANEDALASFDFDLSALDEPVVVPAPAVEPVEAVSTAGLDVSDDPLSTKLDLARVYLDMGDKEGAREVLEELVKEAQGSLKAEAEAMLDSL